MVATKIKKPKKELSKKQKQRIAIAKDAIKQLSVWNVGGGGYCSFGEKVLPEGKNLKKVLPDLEAGCNVCAKGALFLSFVHKYNKITTDEVRNSWGESRIDNYLILEKLTPLFSQEQLDLIERAFEGYDEIEDEEKYGFVKVDVGWGECEYGIVYSYYEVYTDHAQRLEVILKNIIRNNGTFKPQKDKKGQPV